ncbi:GNAT family N-acetyltransferase [Pelomonas sp. KK5]|uniref:GNAT family N-acetyltransferase n=1 Tax=Pelomonas sp. KK5 TaxID=1855730 RepID=UPI00097BF48F|nr:GNAT family N-acetyltransferase [Pelomonas sp. KK5]
MLSLVPVTAEDFDALFELRMASMLENLQRLGLGDRQRSLERFRGQFEPEYMSWILRDGERIGFTKLQPRDGHLHIDHLFIAPGRQGGGVGSWVLERAKSQGRDITLSTLKLSPANEFYLRHGFEKTGEEEFDVQYRWSAST